MSKIRVAISEPRRKKEFEPWHRIEVHYRDKKDYEDCDFHLIKPYDPDYPIAKYVEMIISDGDGGINHVVVSNCETYEMNIKNAPGVNSCDHCPFYFTRAMNQLIQVIKSETFNLNAWEYENE